MGFFNELKRRSVFRMALLYAVGAWAALQVADLLVGVFGLSDRTLPLLAMVLAGGLPLVLILSWFYDWTPQGIRRESDVQDGAPTVSPRINYAIIGFLALGVTLLLIDRYTADPGAVQASSQQAESGESPPPRQARLAILPFRIVGDPPAGDTGPTVAGWVQWFEIRFPDIDIIPAERTEDRQGFSLAEARDELLATHVFTGEHRFEGDEMWARIELLDADREERIWAWVSDEPVYIAGERNPDEGARAEFEITRGLVDHGLTAHRLETDNLQAFVALERARYDSNWRPGQNEEAIRWFREAVFLDPEFAEAHARFAEFWSRQTQQGDQSAEPRQLALKHARIAVELNPENPAAQAALGTALFVEARWGSESERMDREAKIREALDYVRTSVRLAYYDLEFRWRYTSMLRVSALDFTEPCDGGCWEANLEQLQVLYRNEKTHPAVLCLMMESLTHLSLWEEANQRFNELQKWQEADDVPRWCYAHVQMFHRARGEFRLALESIYPEMVSGQLGISHMSYFILLDIGAPEAVITWADHMVERYGDPAWSYAVFPVTEANRALGRFETALSWTDKLVNRPEEIRLRNAALNRFYQLGTMAPDDPGAIGYSATLDGDCDTYEATFNTADGYVIPVNQVSIATACLLHSISQGRPRERLAETLPQTLEESKPYRGLQRDAKPFLKMMVRAALGDAEGALETFRNEVKDGFARLDWLRLWRAHGGPGDLTNGLSSHPEFQAMVEEIEARNAAIRADIESNAPWLVDPAIPKPESESEAEAIASH